MEKQKQSRRRRKPTFVDSRTSLSPGKEIHGSRLHPASFDADRVNEDEEASTRSAFDAPVDPPLPLERVLVPRVDREVIPRTKRRRKGAERRFRFVSLTTRFLLSPIVSIQGKERYGIEFSPSIRFFERRRSVQGEDSLLVPLDQEGELEVEEEFRAELAVTTLFEETIEYYENVDPSAKEILQKLTQSEVTRAINTYFADATVNRSEILQQKGLAIPERLTLETMVTLPFAYEESEGNVLLDQAIKGLRGATYEWDLGGEEVIAENVDVRLIEGRLGFPGGIGKPKPPPSPAPPAAPPPPGGPAPIPAQPPAPTTPPGSGALGDLPVIVIEASDCNSLADALSGNATDIVLIADIQLDCGSLPAIDRRVRITANCGGQLRCTLDALGKGSIFEIKERGVVEMSNLAFSGGDSSSSGGGGAVGIVGGVALFRDCLFFGNIASSGGAVALTGGRAEFVGCVFNENRSDFGGAVGLFQSTASFQSCIFSNNAANLGRLDGGYGGAIDLFDAQNVTFFDCTFTGNIASRDGGAVTVYEGTDVRFEGCTFSTNRAELLAGGVSVITARAHFANCNFGAQQGGGGTDVHASGSQVSHCEMSTRMVVGGDLFFCCCGTQCAGGLSTAEEKSAIIFPVP